MKKIEMTISPRFNKDRKDISVQERVIIHSKGMECAFGLMYQVYRAVVNPLWNNITGDVCNKVFLMGYAENNELNAHYLVARKITMNIEPIIIPNGDVTILVTFRFMVGREEIAYYEFHVSLDGTVVFRSSSSR